MLKSGSLKLHLAALAFAASVSWSGAALAQDHGTLTGVVTDAAGKPLAGAFVQMTNAERHLHFMVITHEQGQYTNNRLPPGKYVVQAVGGEHQSAPSAPVDVAAGQSASANLSVTVARAAALAPAWPGRQPGERGAEAASARGGTPRLADGEGALIVAAKCQFCHDTQRIIRSRGNQARWQQVLGTMKLYAQGSTLAQALTDDEEKVVLAYLATNYAAGSGGGRPKPDPFSRLPRTLLPPSGATTSWSSTNCPTRGRSRMKWRSIRPATAGSPSGSAAGSAGLIVKTLIYTEFVPPSADSKIVRLNAIRRGNAGEFWMVDGGPNRRWLSFDPTTERFTVYNLPPTRSGNASGNTMRVLPDNTVWLNSIGANQVIRLDPATKQFTFFEVPAGVKRNKTANPYGMAVGGDGNVWIVENAVDQIARIDPATGKFEEYPLSVTRSGRT